MPRPAHWLIFCVLLGGCVLPSVRAKKNPSHNDHGIRYYRPKPYLLISPLRETQDTEGPPLDTFVKIELQYLPDFSEEYSLCVTPGLGSADVSIRLDQGWNLTSINQNLDSNVDDNIEALGSLAADIGGAFAPTKATEMGTGLPSMVVRATNVPIGFYEAVVGPGPQGTKQMYGWRYVGFAPFNACPTAILGGTSVCCDDPAAAVYGLAFEDGVMVFRPLHELAGPADTTRVDVTKLLPPGSPGSLPAPAATFAADEALQAIHAFVAEHGVLRSELGAYSVVVQPSWEQADTIRVTIQCRALDEPAQQRLRSMLVQDARLMQLLRDVSPTALIEIAFVSDLP